MPRPFYDPDTEEAAITLELALPLLEDAAGGHVEGLVGDTDPFVAVRQALEGERFDEVIVSTLPDARLALAAARPPGTRQAPGPAGHGVTAKQRALAAAQD